MTRPPTFIIGTGRCGSTALHAVMATHPATAWLASITLRTPRPYAINRAAVRLSTLPWPGRRPPPLTRPTEPYRWWNLQHPEFGKTRRDLVADDVTARSRAGLREAVAHMVAGRRRQPMLKITGWPRVGYLREIFPEARFVHLMRDGRAVATSQIRVDWWHGVDGPEHWLWGPLTTEQHERWEAHGRAPVALAGLGWEILMDRFAAVRPDVPEDAWLEVRYEELCERPAEILGRITEFMELDWPARWDRVDWDERLVNRPGAWRHRLEEHEEAALEGVLEEALVRHGYANAP